MHFSLQILLLEGAPMSLVCPSEILKKPRLTPQVRSRQLLPQ